MALLKTEMMKLFAVSSIGQRSKVGAENRPIWFTAIALVSSTQ